jgi:RNA polymerase sigma-70 factor (sigma-E family)
MDLDGTAAASVPQQQACTGSPRADSADISPAAAVSALYADHALGLIRLAHIMMGNRQAAEDVVQDAFAGLYRRWPHLRDQAKALSYVRSSVLNGCRSELRRRPAANLAGSHGLPVTSAESAVLTAEERREIIHALRSLPNRQREVLVLRFYLDLPDDQIAAAMRISQSTVRSAAYRGLAALGRAMRENP